MTHNELSWEETLWAAGHRVTRQRSMVLDAVCAAGGHTAFGDIYLRVKKIDGSIDRSTVYRALRLFVELGLVLPADTGDEESYYEVARPQPHHHLVCRQCGNEWEIDGTALQAMFGEIERRHSFEVATDHLVLFGLCATCRGLA
jgi:Fur family transcriptional regulator, ferric uptake regulator